MKGNDRRPSRLDIFLAGLTENSHRGLPAVIAGASNAEAKRAFWPVMCIAFLAYWIGKALLGTFAYGLAAAVIASVVIGLVWRVARGRRTPSH